MPWTEKDDLDVYKKGMTDKQKKQWVAVANSARQKCIDAGGETDACDAKAIRIANGVIKSEESMDMSMNDTRDILEKELNKNKAESESHSWINDIWEDEFVYTDDFQSYKCSYVIDDKGVATIGSPVKVNRKTIYEPTESRKDAWVAGDRISGDIVKLIEADINKDDGEIPIKLIQPGWGSSGYYPEAMLKRDGPKVFKKGLHMYWDHPTATEESDRPERSLRDLAGVLTTDAEWKNSGIYGAGLYASAKVTKPFRDAVKELAPHIGTSIRAFGVAEKGEADGQKGAIIEEITDAASVDFVTRPGAGGKVLELFESYRAPDSIERKNRMDEILKLQESNKELTDKLDAASAALKAADAAKLEAEEELKKKDGELKAATDEIAKQAEALVLKQAATFVESKLAGIEMPEVTRQRLVEKLSKAPVLTEDKKLDEVKFGEEIDKVVKEETDYLAKVMGSGKITGMGESQSTETPKLEESFKGLYIKQGYSEEVASKMAKHSGA